MAKQVTTEPFSPADAAWLHMEDPTNLMMITGIWTLDTPIDEELVRRLTEERFLRFRRFRMRVTGGRRPIELPRWEVDPTFDLAAHLHHVALPAPGERAQLQRLVSDLMSTPLDFSKPPWQVHLVDNVEGGSALVYRLHHCLADGIALVRVMLSTTDERLEPLPAEAEEGPGELHLPLVPSQLVRGVEATLQTGGALLHGGLQLLRDPARAVDAVREGARAAAALGHLLLLSPDPQTLFKGPLGVSKRAAWSAAVPLGEVKDLGQHYGATVNDVLLAALSGALRRYVVGRGDAADGLDIRAAVPVNLRPPEEPLSLGNRFGLVFLSLPIGLPRPAQRLHELKRRMDQIKASAEAVVAFGILNAIGVAPDELENVVVELFGSKATAVMTNVPGPRQTLHYGGHAVRDMMAFVPQSGRLGLGISILSYAGQVRLGIACDAGLVPDPQTIVDAFHDEFGRLQPRTVRGRGRTPAGRARKPTGARRSR